MDIDNNSPVEQNQEINPVKHKNNRSSRKLIFIILVATLAGLIGVGYYLYANYFFSSEEVEVTSNSQQEPEDTATMSMENQPVIIYTERSAAEKDADGKSWYTYTVYRKIGASDPEALAEVGGIRERPEWYKLSPGNTQLLINLESKLQALDLETKQIEDLFTPNMSVRSAEYSPEGDRLFIWDQRNSLHEDDMNAYYAHVLNLESRQSKTVIEGASQDSPGRYHSLSWRNDNKIILNEGFRAQSLWYLDLNNNELSRGIDGFYMGHISDSGNLAAIPEAFTPSVCHEYHGRTTSSYKIIEPVSGDKLEEISSEDDLIIVSFSPDDKEVLYRTEELWANRDDCNKDARSEYYVLDVSSGDSIEIPNSQDILKSWDENFVGATLERRSTIRTTYPGSSTIANNRSENSRQMIRSINIDGETIVESEEELAIIGQFYN